MAARRSSSQPSREKSPSLSPHPRNVKVIADPAHLVGDAVDQLGEGAGRLAGVERPDREAVAQDEPGQPRRSSGRAAGAAR